MGTTFSCREPLGNVESQQELENQLLLSRHAVSGWKLAVLFTDGNRRQKRVDLFSGTKFTASDSACRRGLPGGPRWSRTVAAAVSLQLWLLAAHSGSGGDHAFVPLAVGHRAPVVIGHATLVGLLLAPVQEGL